MHELLYSQESIDTLPAIKTRPFSCAICPYDFTASCKDDSADFTDSLTDFDFIFIAVDNSLVNNLLMFDMFDSQDTYIVTKLVPSVDDNIIDNSLA